MKIGRYEIDEGDDRSTRHAVREMEALQKEENPVRQKMTKGEYEYVERLQVRQNSVDTAEYYDQARDIMERNKDLDFIQRAINAADGNQPSIGNTTHLMSYYGPEENGDYIMYPMVVRDPENESELKQFETHDDAIDHAITSGEFVNIGSDPFFAEYMTQVGYKYAFPQDAYDEAVANYVNSW